MNITINNQKHTVEFDSFLETIIKNQLGDKQKGVAVAVNETVVLKANWEHYVLHEHDSVLIIKATQGG